MRVLGFGGGQISEAAGYEVANSLRFNDGSTDYLTKSTVTPTDNTKGTFSCWFKRGDLGGTKVIFGGGTDIGVTSGTKDFRIYLDSDYLEFYQDDYDITGNNTIRFANTLLRDPSAWYHLCVAIDTGQGDNANKVKFYLNGTQLTASLISLSESFTNIFFNTASLYQHIGVYNYNTTQLFDGYMAEVVFVDGQQLDPTSFGEFDADTGIWKPIDVSGLTFGTNGFYLDFENSGSLGADVSGNGNNFTVNNLTSIDQTTDTPTNNFATINPLFNDTANIATMSDGNLTILSTTGSWTTSPASLAFSSGKWYYEVKWLTGTGGDYTAKVGWGNPDKGKFMETQGSILYRNSNGQKLIDNSGSSYGATWTTGGDIIGVAIDVDGGTVTFYKNGSSQGDITISGGLDDGTFIIPFIQLGNTDKVSVNFGNPPFTISSGNSDGNGYGNFEYAVPSGYYALNTKNLAEYG